MQLTAVYVEANDGGYTAYCEEIPAAISEGDTLEEARHNLHDALRVVLECNRELAREQIQKSGVRETIDLVAP